MQSIRQNLRPKHQVLILRCYPRFQKNAVEVKPNSSELSYLLYYASTRRSKLQKVFTFLEKKTISDVWRARIGNVQVTLQIVKALIEKCPRDLPLFSQSVLNILDSILKSQDATLVEESVIAFDAFCSHYDSATLAADVEHASRYEEIVHSYARFASKNPQAAPAAAAATAAKGQASFPLQLRYRSAGLSAIKALVSSTCFSADATRHCKVLMPAILDNIYSERQGYLALLRYRDSAKESKEKESAAHRKRPSMQLSRNTIDFVEGDAMAAMGTTADVDAKAEEEVGLLALQCLRQVYSADNRGLLRLATNSVLDFALSHVSQAQRPIERNAPKSWAAQVFELVCRWTPVQDRFVVLVTIVEALIKSPIREDDVPNQLQLASVIDSLLRSNINLIGLSIMDVLLGLLQHTLLMLQLGGAGSKVHPHHQQADALGTMTPSSHRTSPSRDPPQLTVEMEIVQAPSQPRVLLLDLMQACMGDLATHVYYADQIGDMVAAIMMRLKPAVTTAVPSTASAIADPSGAADAVAESASLSEKPHTDGFFSFATARLLALNSVRDIIETANSRRRDGNNPTGRNAVGVSAWNGTQWLLRDPDPKIRRAYVQSLLTWLSLETDKGDLRINEAQPRVARSTRPTAEQGSGGNYARRAASNASQRTNHNPTDRTSFLQLLSLAIYENALQYAESESDILLLHLLLTQLVQRLGTNSVRCQLPMIFRLQEDIPSLQTAEAKVCVGSLVHGYFWAVCDFFEVDTSPVGRAIFLEVDRRSKTGAWLDSVHMPPMGLEQIHVPTAEQPTHHVDPGVAATASLKPFDARQELVQSLAEAYSIAFFSPPGSPLASPGRALSSSSVPRVLPQSGERALPAHVKEQMLAEWTRETCTAAAERDAIRASSIAGSKVGSVTGSRQPAGPVATHYGDESSGSVAGQSRPRTPTQDGGLGRRGSTMGSMHSPKSNETTQGLPIIRVGQLKDILAGHRMTLRPSTAHRYDEDDTDSESMISIGQTGSNISLPFVDANTNRNERPVDLSEPGTANLVSEPHPRKLSLEGKVPNGRTTAGAAADRDVPPVPMLPPNSASHASPSGVYADMEDKSGRHSKLLEPATRTSTISGTQRAGMTADEHSGAKATSLGKQELHALLSGAQMLPRTRPLSTFSKPPPS